MDVSRSIADVIVECVRGDITRQAGIEAIVNAANARLAPGGGVAGAIHAAAGSGLYDECRPLAPIAPGQAVITGGHGLPNPYVIHCLGPRYGEDLPSDRLLADCYRNALRLADARGLASIAFPSLSTGVFGYPRAEAAGVAVTAVAETAPSLESVRLVRFVLWDDEALRVHEEALARVSSGGPSLGR
jgi:O-acetyl-ADP-ribose deacetylase (regulator of RNase III)